MAAVTLSEGVSIYYINRNIQLIKNGGKNVVLFKFSVGQMSRHNKR